MIEQNATVLSVAGHRAVVSARGSSGCGACASGGGCGVGVLGRLFGGRSSELEAEAPFPVEAGDEVVIGLREDALLRGSLWVYLVPLVAFILGAVVGQTVADNIGAGEGFAIIGALAGGLAGARLAAAHARARRDDSLYRPVILRRQGGSPLAVRQPA